MSWARTLDTGSRVFLLPEGEASPWLALAGCSQPLSSTCCLCSHELSGIQTLLVPSLRSVGRDRDQLLLGSSKELEPRTHCFLRPLARSSLPVKQGYCSLCLTQMFRASCLPSAVQLLNWILEFSLIFQSVFCKLHAFLQEQGLGLTLLFYNVTTLQLSFD